MSDLRVAQLNPDAQMIDFGIGQPDFRLLPLELLRDAAARRLARDDRQFLNYGYELGDGYFRQQLAEFLQQETGATHSARALMVTTGASQGLDLICTHFAQADDVVFVEEPTYFLALRIFADRHLRVVSVPSGPAGLDLDALQGMLARQRPAFLYTVPTYQNPSGATMPAAQRARLVQLAREYDFLIVADEVYHLLNYEGAPPPPLASHIDSKHVLSLGSFSKILAPGLRLGWIAAAPTLLQPLAGSGLLDSGGGLNPFTSNIVGALLHQEQLAPHIARLKAVYKRRAACMDAALQHYFGASVRYTKPKGGFFFWAALRDGLNADTLLPVARQQGVGFQAGRKFSARGACQNYMRLGFTFYDEARIETGIQRLAELAA